MVKEFLHSLSSAFQLEREIKKAGKEANLNKLIAILDQDHLSAVENKDIRLRLTTLVIQTAQENLVCGLGYRNLAEGFGFAIKFLPHFINLVSQDTKESLIRTANLISTMDFPRTVNWFINETLSQKEKISVDPTKPSLSQIEEAIKILTDCSQNPNLKLASMSNETYGAIRQWLEKHLASLFRLEKELKRKFSPDLKKTFKKGDVIKEGNVSWIITAVHEGGQSVVFIVKNPLLDRKEVLRFYKAPTPPLLQAANSLIRIREDLPQNLSPYLPEIYGVLNDNDGRQFLRMQLIDGVDTERLMKTQPEGRLTQEQVVKILRIGVPLLYFLHLQYPKGPLVLRDIKPTNIMIYQDQKGSVSAVYFPDWDTATRQGRYFDKDSAWGTEAYATPEQMYNPQTGYYEVSPESDVYALGITIAQWLTGVEPKGPNYHGSFQDRFPELIKMTQNSQLNPAWLELVEGCTRTLSARWSIADIRNWLKKYFPA